MTEPPRIPEIPGLLEALEPLDAALLAHHRGEEEVVLEVRFDDGTVDRIPAAHFFRSPDELDDLEARALALARGRVLDVGAGAGAFALPLQARGHEVTALEILPGAARILRERGVEDVRQESVWTFQPEGRYDTLLLLMNGTGIAGTRGRLPLLLRRLASWTRCPTPSDPSAPSGQILVDSTALEGGEADGDELQIQLEPPAGPPFPHLYAPPEALRRAAEEAGVHMEVMARDPDSDHPARYRYLARLRAGPG